MGNSLICLSDGPRDLPERQRTLRDTIRWSYELLEPAERSLFESLAVFVDGWSLAAAEALASPEERPDVLNVLASLIDKSLVRQCLLHVRQRAALPRRCRPNLCSTCCSQNTRNAFRYLASRCRPRQVDLLANS